MFVSWGGMSRAYKVFSAINRRDYYCKSLGMTWAHIKRRLTEQGVTIAEPHPDHEDRTFSRVQSH